MTPVDAQDLYARFTLDSASTFLFGACTDTLKGAPPTHSQPEFTYPPGLAGPLPIAGQAAIGPKGSRTEDEFGSFAAVRLRHPIVPSPVTLLQAFEESQTHIAKRFRYGNLVWPVLELLQDKTTEPTNVIRAWLDPMVHRVVSHKEASVFVFDFEKKPRVDTGNSRKKEKRVIKVSVRSGSG